VDPNFSVLLNSPEAASRMASLGAYVRFETSLPARVKSLAALATARESDGDYVWTANERQARRVGLDDSTIDAIRNRRAPEGLSAGDATVVRFTLELLRRHRVAESTFKMAHAQLGDAGVTDLLVFVGYYFALSHVLSALEVVEPPGGVRSTLSAPAP
jgi:4-carboxymuconolactone decarboxylase